MAESRFTGLALGPYANFFARSSNVFTSGDTTPDVTNGAIFYTANTSRTVITHFDLSATQGGNVSQFFEGKVITVVFLDTATQLTAGAQLNVGPSGGTIDPKLNTQLTLVYHNSAWNTLSSGMNYDSSTVTLSAAGTPTISVGQASVILLNGTDATANLVLHRFSNISAGQRFWVVPNSGGIVYKVDNSGGFLTIAGTAAMTIAVTGVYEFVAINTGQVIMSRPAA